MAIKPIRSDQRVTFVWLDDPAIDIQASAKAAGENIEKLFSRLAKDPSSWRDLLVCHPGQRPTEFVFGVIPPSELSEIEDDCHLNRPDFRLKSLQWRVFCAALRDIRNGPSERVKDESGRWRDTVPMDGERVDRDWLEQTFVRGLRSAAMALGSSAWVWQHLSEDDAKNSSGRSSQAEDTGTGAQPARSAPSS